MVERQTIRSAGLEATFLPALGMVCSSLRVDDRELLELRGGPAAYAERSSTFGIPLLAPWANRLGAWRYSVAGTEVTLDPQSPYVHRDGATGLPIHGLLAASRFWSLTNTSQSELCAELDFGAHSELLASFPFPHRLDLCAVAQPTRLRIRLTLTPTGDVAVPISFGFHPWLRLPGADRDGCVLELPVRRRLRLDERQLPTGDTEELAAGALDGPLSDRTFDDCFDVLAADGAFAVTGGGMRVAVEFVSGYAVAQVYAPEASGYICFEPMTAPVDALRTGVGLGMADPGSSFTAEFAVSVTRN